MEREDLARRVHELYDWLIDGWDNGGPTPTAALRQSIIEAADDIEGASVFNLARDEVAATSADQRSVAPLIRAIKKFRDSFVGHPGKILEPGMLPECYRGCDAIVESIRESLGFLLDCFSYSNDSLLVPGVVSCYRYARERWGRLEMVFELEREDRHIVARFTRWDHLEALEDYLRAGDLFLFPLPTKSVNQVLNPLVYRRKGAFE